MSVSSPYAPIERADSYLRTVLSQAGASPFLAHHVLEDAPAVLEAVRTAVNGQEGALDLLFRRFPAVAIWSAAATLATSYGEDGDHALYGHLATAYGYDTDLTNEERRTLRSLFRRAVLNLGLPLPAEGEIIKEYGRAELKALPADDFFSQVGVVLSQSKELALIFQKAEGAFGAPAHDDSTANQARWERDAVLEFCPPGLRRLPKAMLFDWSGYHAGLYARILTGEVPDTPFAKALYSAREKLPAPRSQFMPRLVCYDGELGVRDGSSSGGFFAKLRGEERYVRPGTILPLTAPWPTSIDCWSPKSDASTARPLAVLDTNTSFLLFDAVSGREIGTAMPTMTRITVPYGELVVASREPFTVGDRDSVEAGVGAHLLYVDVVRPVSLRSRVQTIELTPRPSPSLKMLATSMIGRSGGAQFLAGIHAVEVHFPSAGELDSTGIELHLTHPAIGEAPLVISRDLGDGTSQHVSLGSVLPERGEFGLLKIELKRPGFDRVVMRVSAWYWPGLSELIDGATFKAPAVPANFDEQRSQHISRHANGALNLAPADHAPYLTARLVFRAPNDANAEQEPLAEFALSPPGVSIVFREANGKEKPLPHGQSLALSPEDGSAIIIRTSQPLARLDVKGVRESQSFDRFGVRRMTSIALSGVAQGPSEHSEVRYQDPRDPKSWRVLIRITEVVSVLHFAATLSGDEHRITVALPRVPERLRICGRGLLYEEDFSLLEGDDALYVTRGNNSEPMQIVWRTDSLPRVDVYMVSLDVDFGDGRWRTLTNPRRDRFDVAVRHPELDDATVAERPPHAGLPIRLTQVLQRCAALPCWGSIEKHVLPLWRATVKSLATSTPPDWSLLMSTAATGWDPEASVTWVPIHHPIEVAINTFSAPLAYFDVYDRQEDRRGGEPIGWLARFASPDMTASAMVQQHIDPRVFASFSNIAALSRDPLARPRGFEFRMFEAAIGTVPREERESLWTPRQGRLTQAHHRWCCERYADRLADVHVRGHNEDRIHNLRELCLYAKLVGEQLEEIERLHLPCPVPLYAQKKDDDRILLTYVPYMLSLLAKHSRYGTPEQLLIAFERKAPKSRQSILHSRHSILQTFSFLIRLAPELFAFYLLLWELAARGDLDNE